MIAAFFLGYLAGMVTLVGASWLGSVLAKRSRPVPPAYSRDVPLTMTEHAARRERLTQSLLRSAQ